MAGLTTTGKRTISILMAASVISVVLSLIGTFRIKGLFDELSGSTEEQKKDAKGTRNLYVGMSVGLLLAALVFGGIMLSGETEEGPGFVTVAGQAKRTGGKKLRKLARSAGESLSKIGEDPVP